MKEIPISAAREISTKFEYPEVVIFAYDPDSGRMHVTTYGKSPEQCRDAARAGNDLKRTLGWPEELCHAKPSRTDFPKKKKLYLSGKITGDPHYKDKFHTARLQLEASGYEVIDPSNFGLPDDIPWEKAMRFDIGKLVCCDALAVSSDWQESKGAVIEAGLAHDIGMMVKPVKEWLDA